MADEVPGSIVTIEEKTGKRRTVELRGPCLPHRGASWKGEQRLVTTWYSGNPFEATQQVLGAVEMPSDWEGTLTTNRMYSCPSIFRDGPGAADKKIVRASTMRDILDDFARSGALLRVTWATNDNRSIVREGRIGPFEFPHERMDDIGWRLTFVWIGRGDTQARVLSTRNENSEAALRELQGALTDLESSIAGAIDVASNAALPLSADSFTLGDLEAFAAAPKQALASVLRVVTSFSNRVGRIGDLIQDVSNTPAELRGQMMDALTDIKGVMQRQVVEISRRPAEGVTTRPEKPSAVARAALYFGRAGEKAGKTSAACTGLARVVRRHHVASSSRTERIDRASAADVIATHRVSRGETFAALGIKFYGDPEKGAGIAIANNLPGYQIAPAVGASLVIPVLKSVSDSGRVKS